MNGKGTFDFVAECERLEKLNAEMLKALKRAAPWIGKMIADGHHLDCVMPNDCVCTLDMIEDAIAKAEGSK